MKKLLVVCILCLAVCIPACADQVTNAIVANSAVVEGTVVAVADPIASNVIVAEDPIASNAADSNEVFGTALTAFIGVATSGLDWKSGYVRSVNHPEKEGIALKVSKTFKSLNIGSYEIGIKGDLLAVQNCDDNLYGFGVSLDLSKIMKFDCGISYLPGGYGLSYNIYPISF